MSKKNVGSNSVLALTGKIFTIFFVSAFGGAILGEFLNNAFNIRPWGTLIVLGIFFILSWIVFIRINGQLTKQIKETYNNRKDNESEK